MTEPNLTLQDVVNIIGSKEIELYQLRTQVVKANEIIGVLEQKIRDLMTPAKSVPEVVE